ncbi:4-hydroxybenzoate polyprenyltransferase [Orbus hercynius]|uniref:4-hydroxybenzoate octaprenyltransferase n=1 Tax=Orbus hercynius TaxID=593135 RepID=A0A495RGW9_9GAMM|nr:4-hydroxybenzoate octaprenyltransferase [Orbus hercynius]RKS86008.1 4-hydroxybenzoate polyprenyltransferase [Orbus hercynius]
MKNFALAYCKLMRLDKPIGTLLLLWPTLWALWLVGEPTLKLFIVFTLGVFLMRSAGCVVNDFADRKFDGSVLRTRNRPLASGQLTSKNALFIFLVLIVISVLLLFTLPPLTWLIACFAFLTTLVYPFMKRFTHFPQLILGIAFSWGIPMVYAATLGSFPLTCWLLCIANICWTIAYDTMYAMVDRDDDLKIGIKSTAILFGENDKLCIAILQTMTVLLLIMIAVINQLAVSFYFALFAVVLLFIYQQTLIANRNRECCFKAFLNNNYIGLSIFIGLLVNHF